MTNRKFHFHTRFRLVPKSMTLDDCTFSESTTKIWMKMGPYYQRQWCSAMTSFWQYKAHSRGFFNLWRQGVKRQWGNLQRRLSGLSDATSLWHHRKWGQRYYIVLFSPLSPFHWPQNTWPWMTLNGQFTLNFHYDEQPFKKIILHTHCRVCLHTWSAEMCGSEPWSAEYLGSTGKKLRIFRRRHILGTLTNKASISI